MCFGLRVSTEEGDNVTQITKQTTELPTLWVSPARLGSFSLSPGPAGKTNQPMRKPPLTSCPLPAPWAGQPVRAVLCGRLCSRVRHQQKVLGGDGQRQHRYHLHNRGGRSRRSPAAHGSFAPSSPLANIVLGPPLSIFGTPDLGEYVQRPPTEPSSHTRPGKGRGRNRPFWGFTPL